MTIVQYLQQSLQAFGLSDAMLADITIEADVDMDAEYTADVQAKVGKAMCSSIEMLLFTPRMSNVSENGFSMSWDYANLGKYYLWLCRRWGVKPNEETVNALGLNTITDRSGIW